jgi:hypothetical protein
MPGFFVELKVEIELLLPSKKQQIMKTYLLAVLSLVVGLLGCKKDEVEEEVKKVPEASETITSAEDHSLMEGNVYASYDIADDLNRTTEYDTVNGVPDRKKAFWFPTAAEIIWADSTFKDGNGIEYTIDFGPLKATAPKGTLCRDGRYRAGKVHVSLSNRYKEINAQVKLWADESDAFYSGDGTNMTLFSKTHTWTRKGDDTWKVEVRNAKAVNENGTITWESDRELKRIKGGETLSMLDDEFEITGGASGVNRSGKPFTVSIETPLKKVIQTGCAGTFVKGILKLQNEGSSQSITLDYDPYQNEACDRFAKVTIAGKEQIITVR